MEYLWKLLIAAAAILTVAVLAHAGSLDNPSGVSTADDPVVWTGTHTNTAQPCFLAFNSVDDLDVTGDGTVVTVDFDTEVFDQGNDFLADTFTAPVTGRYLLTANVTLLGIVTAGGASIQIVTSNRDYRGNRFDLASGLEDNMGLTISVVADMDAADTATVTVQVTGETGTPIDIDGDASAFTTFSGCLLS